ncbi:SDR family oxidoreductase [Ferrovibrio sp.]|uniref:SDR family oxidoreductase n=1 Tax=Ferrovibrio sp. TaxID=1917215 RepID=UPI000CC2368F|nr:SDR family oxidoreductase [Ferrovibrio sp.]PJI42216.1 MAG: hypothetical protein CTR53_07205 [Ferrovibrio sp.]
MSRAADSLDETVIVTGAAAGIGKAIATGLLHRGASVVVADVSETSIKTFRAELSETPFAKACRFIRVDLRQPEASEKIVGFAVSEFGPVTALINNAGVGRNIIRKNFLENPPKFWEMTDPVWDIFLSVNTTAAFRLMRAAIPIFRRQGKGRIINVTTSLDSMLVAGSAGYGASKAATESLSAIAAQDLLGTGITVNVVVPGGVTDTAFIPQDAPILRSSMLPPEVMVPPIAWLLGSEAEGVTARRFRANLWDQNLPGAEAAERAGAPIAWSSLTGQLRAAQLRR